MYTLSHTHTPRLHNVLHSTKAFLPLSSRRTEIHLPTSQTFRNAPIEPRTATPLLKFTLTRHKITCPTKQKVNTLNYTIPTSPADCCYRVLAPSFCTGRETYDLSLSPLSGVRPFAPDLTIHSTGLGRCGAGIVIVRRNCTHS